ncbi:MAG: hypothetical protein IKX45_08215 [Bacteroidales bacterium]|nr:hypothetical protein [Bacteroidales bacterium]
MKKTYTLISVIALAALAVGCAKELDNNDAYEKTVLDNTNTSVETITVTLSVPESVDTKTALGTKDGGSYPVKWSAEDPNRISLNGSAPTESTKDSDTQITASFKPTAGLSVYNFLYRGDAGHDNQVTIPAAQTYYANDFDDATMPMYAASASRSSSVTFSHLCSLLKFSITGDKKIDSVTLTAVDDEKSLSGTFTIGKTAELLNGTLTPTTGGGSVNYNFNGHKQLSNTPFVFYVAIPAGTYEGGINVHIVDNNQGHMDFKVLRDNTTITAGKVRELDTFEYEQVKDPTLKMIWNAAKFEEFVTAVANGEKNLNARLTPDAASIDLSEISFESIDDYQGTFDGNGKTLIGLSKPMFNNLKGVVKNLTLNSTISITDASDYNLGIFARQVVPSSEIDDIGGLQNCTAQGSITYTPSSALSANPSIGGMVGNNRGGAFINCTNEATVTFANNAGITHTGDRQPSIGGVVGRSQKGGDLSTQGNISSCTNSGTVSCEEQFEGNIMIGGVIGYGVEAAESISGCSNSGLVKAASTCSTTKVLHIGGVAGMFKGNVESCSNLTAGTVTTESGSSAGTYLCQGGVFGRLNNGSETYSGISNAGTVNVAATGGSTLRLVGGVVGRCNEGAKLTECTNSGNINYTASDANKTYIGGVVASNTTSGNTLEGCQSTGGTLSYSGATTSSDLIVGGVVGYCNKSISNCSNAMTISATGTMARDNNNYICFGGVAGYVTGANVIVTNCTNSGAINYGQTVTGNGQTYVGGLVGAVTKSEISGGGNSGTFTFTGRNTSKAPSIGGVVGRVFSNDTESGYALSDNVTNSGAIVLNSSESSSQYLYAGGLVGQHAGGNIYGTNNASITVTEVHVSFGYLGGLVGYMPGGAIVTGSANTAAGDIILNGWTVAYHSFVGGIVGMSCSGTSPYDTDANPVVPVTGGGTITGASNAGDITMGSGCSIPRTDYIGGIAGYTGAAINSSHNTGNITNNYSQTESASGGKYAIKDLCIGGIAGVSAAALSSCYNTGNITNNGSTYNVEINVAGVVGASFGNLTSCSNGTASLAGGTISNTATSGTSSRQDMQVGGVIGNNRGSNTITSCFNKGAVSNSGLGAKISIGGLAGWSTAPATYTSTCYNTGSISNSGTGSSNPGLCMGGLLGVARGANTLTGTASVYNYNSGTLLEESETQKVAVGGICGYNDNAAADFAYAHNLSTQEYGDIWIQNNTRDKIYIGGILGMSAVASSLNYANNAGKILFKDLTLSSTGQVFAGGIIGGWTASGTQTIDHCTNSGCIECDSSDHNDFNVSSTATPLWSCFGGISGMGASDSSEALESGWFTISGKTFTNCSNSGYIWIYGKMRCCIGGVVAYSENNPNGCESTGYIQYHKSGGIGQTSNPTNYHRQIVGGVVGLCTASSLTNLKFSATKLYTNGSSPFAYTGGIAGLVLQDTSFSNCKVGATGTGDNEGFRAAGSTDGTVALFCRSGTTARSYTFTNCKVATGSHIWYAKGSRTEVTNDNISISWCTGDNGSLSSGSLPTVGSID